MAPRSLNSAVLAKRSSHLHPWATQSPTGPDLGPAPSRTVQTPLPLAGAAPTSASAQSASKNLSLAFLPKHPTPTPCEVSRE